MRKWIFLPLIFGSLVLQAEVDPSCRGCAAGKLMLQCDHYVAKQGMREKQTICAEYAEIVNVDGASAKASWYYLLAGKPDKALDAAERAIKVGHTYANEYLAYALLIQGKESDAIDAMQHFRQDIQQNSFIKRDIESLQKLYPDIDFGKLKK
jgi:tetratricopeptide (TPR) repeat protein